MVKALGLAALFSLIICARLNAQQPEPAGENLLRLQGTDATSGIHYLKLILLLKPLDAHANAAPEALPRFTVECWEQSSKRSLHWLVRFDGSPSFDFQPPSTSTASDPNPKPNPSTDLKMRFEGYMRSPEFKRQWEKLPTGELRYRNPGLYSSNLDDPRFFLRWLTSLPNLRVGFLKPAPGHPKELVFPTQPLLDIVKKADLCQP